MKRLIFAAIAIAALTRPAAAQDSSVGGTGVVTTYPPGWAFTPSFRFATMADDNISLFSVSNGTSGDFLSTYSPAGELRYTGRQTRVDAGYGGSFLTYHTFSALNQWSQSLRGGIARQESTQFSWFANTTFQAVPTTDVLEISDIPYRRTGADLTNIQTGATYTLGIRDTVTGFFREQVIRFDRPDVAPEILRGGDVDIAGGTYLHQLTERLGLGATYERRHGSAIGIDTDLAMHDVEAIARYRVAPDWSVGGGFGFVHLESTPLSPATTSPSWSALADHTAPYGFVHINYSRTYLPSLSFGGSVQSQQLSGSFHAPLFGSPRFYTDDVATYSDSDPITPFGQHLPLRSLRATALVGWQADRWVHIEGFYTRVYQTTLVTGAQVGRNVVGFQIVTAKPMRIE